MRKSFIVPLRSPLLVGLGLVVAALAQGCGSDGPEMARVSGKVTYKGAPVPKGTISFVSTSGGRNATAEIQADGTYRLQSIESGDGAIVGDYDVAISSKDEVVLDYTPVKAPPPPKYFAPQKYEDPKSSGLKAKVKSGSNTFDFDLVD
ncbi:MAG: carboxypeptidase-like regulatory domain-containing protein [Isosphaeraceae bacterium]|nr:carboxypeptidase-like regulatory domain-containing protein [Isosphaeraceae bacterium]